MELKEIKQQLTINHVLQHYGLKPDKNQRLVCPFHNDKNPSLQIYPKTNTYCCFSSRIFAYINIAAYEALRPAYKNYPSYAGKLNGLQPVPLPKQGKQYSYPVASVITFSTVTQKLVFDGHAIKKMEQDYITQLQSFHMDQALLDSSVSFGRAVGNYIIVWAAADGYLQRNSLPAFIVTQEAGRW